MGDVDSLVLGEDRVGPTSMADVAVVAFHRGISVAMPNGGMKMDEEHFMPIGLL